MRVFVPLLAVPAAPVPTYIRTFKSGGRENSGKNIGRTPRPFGTRCQGSGERIRRYAITFMKQEALIRSLQGEILPQRSRVAGYRQSSGAKCGDRQMKAGTDMWRPKALGLVFCAFLSGVFLPGAASAIPAPAPSARSLSAPAPASAPVTLVCVEAVWCSIAQQVGGALVRPQVLITTEGLDPHHLQPTPSMARALAGAQGVIVNGATYDDWALALSRGNADGPQPERFVVSQLAGWKEGEDPHLFFSPPFVLKTAQAIAAWLQSRFPEQKEAITNRLQIVAHQVMQVESRLDVLKGQAPAAPVAMLEPAGARLLEAAGFDIVDPRWAHMAMEGNGASPQETAALEAALTGHKVRFLVVNPALDSPSMTAMVACAQRAGVPLVRIGESLPSGENWAQWMNHLLDEITVALRMTARPSAPLPTLP
ncbi:hypothetical protein E3E11_03925 [Oecophyllibacter saccharovorans]|nr:hypothetical protein E3E11_03925 [Oecophyllibacter saccharovorans]